jgi:ComF family protein
MAVYTSALMLVGNVLLEAVAPTQCAACDTPLAPRVLFCPSCAATVIRADPARATGCVAAFEYGGAIATAITRMKYADRPDLAPRLAEAMRPASRCLRGAAELVVPVPLHPKRLAERGYNQSALLGAKIARTLHARYAPRALVRVRDTPKQSSLDRAERLVNLQNAFRVRGESMDYARILLVDDVKTTGATLEACAAALHEAGARQVLALVLACRA